MTKRDLLAVAIRIMGLALLVQAITVLPIFVAQLCSMQNLRHFSPADSFLTGGAGPVIFTSIVGVILMACANGLARKMVSEDSNLDWPEWLCDKAALFDFIARIYGVVLLAQSIPLLVVGIVNWLNATENNLWRSGYESMLNAALTAVIGVCLVVGFGKIANCMSNLISRGRKTLEGPGV